MKINVEVLGIIFWICICLPILLAHLSVWISNRKGRLRVMEIPIYILVTLCFLILLSVHSNVRRILKIVETHKEHINSIIYVMQQMADFLTGQKNN